MTSRPTEAPPVVVDTNIVLDMFVFSDAAAQPLREALEAGTLQWIATPAMREELERVLGYPQIARRLAVRALEPASVIASFRLHVKLQEAALRAPLTCADADDQKFIDLAVAHRALLISKDNAVLGLSARLRLLGVRAATEWTG